MEKIIPKFFEEKIIENYGENQAKKIIENYKIKRKVNIYNEYFFCYNLLRVRNYSLL